MKKSILFVLMFCSSLANAQTLLERIVDSVSIKERHEFILSKLDSAFVFDNRKSEFVRPFEPENVVIHEIYNCDDYREAANIVNLQNHLVDTNMFNKNYFVSGKFLEDWVDLKEQGKAKLDYFSSLIRPFVFDTVNDKAYSCIGAKPRLVEIHHVSTGVDTIYSKFGYEINERFEDCVFIGKLFKAKTVEFVFRYPTFVRKDDEDFCDGTCIFWNTGYCFAMKGKQFFYIDLCNEKIYPMEEVVENHWDWITNVIKKQDRQMPE